MSLSENIYRLRTEKRMSQGDLAEALEVSRQSVSKWETGAATPELDKLMKMSQLFGVSLDELVTGTSTPVPETPPVQSPPASAQAAGNPQRTWGLVLFVGSLCVFLALSMMGGILTGLLFSLPLLVPGLLCLFSKKHTALKCVWAEFILIGIFLEFATGTNWMTFFAMLRNWRIFMDMGINILHPIISLAQGLWLLALLIWTVRSLNKNTKPLSTCALFYLLAGWCVYLMTFIPYQLPIDLFSIWYRIVASLIHWSELGLLTILLVFTWRMIKTKSWKKN